MTRDFIKNPSRAITKLHNLATEFPDAAQYWSDRNPVNPSQVAPFSNKWAWWICDQGHEYDATVVKVAQGRRCPYCAGKRIFPGFNDLATVYPEIAKDLDDEKNDGLTADNIFARSSKRLWFKCEKGHEAYSIVNKRVKSRGCPKCKERTKRGPLSQEHPDIAVQWDKEKNGSLTPDNVTSGSNKVVWWICNKGHSYDDSVKSKVSIGVSSCPVCKGSRIIVGVNDLATVFPHLAAQWDYEKNDFTPQEVASKSMKEAHWKCEKGHTWKTLINRRAYGEGCPYCANKRVFKGGNDLATTHPDVASEWDFEENDIRPSDVTSGSNTVVSWICPKGHKYKRSPKSRTGPMNTGCSYCTGRDILVGFNDLATTHKSIIEKEWDFRKNDVSPSEVSFGMLKRVWWSCDKGHSYEMPINSRVSKGYSCTKCMCSKEEMDLANFVIDILG